MALAGPNVGGPCNHTLQPSTPHSTAGICCKKQWAQILYCGPFCLQLETESKRPGRPKSPSPATHTGHSSFRFHVNIIRDEVLPKPCFWITLDPPSMAATQVRRACFHSATRLHLLGRSFCCAVQFTSTVMAEKVWE